MRPIPGREHKSMSLKCCTIFILQLRGSSTTAVMSIYASKRYFGSTIMWSALAILGGDFKAKKKRKRQIIQQRNKNDDKKSADFWTTYLEKLKSQSADVHMWSLPLCMSGG